MASATVTLIGSGGVRHVFDLPLSEAFADQLAKGALIAASESDQRTLAAFAAGDTAPAGDTVGRPEDGASKGEWVGFAVSQGMSESEAKKTSKANLIALFPSPAELESDADTAVSEDDEPEPDASEDDELSEPDDGLADSADDPA